MRRAYDTCAACGHAFIHHSMSPPWQCAGLVRGGYQVGPVDDITEFSPCECPAFIGSEE